MTGVLAVLIVLAVAAYVVLPFLQQFETAHADAAPAGDELWKREKAVAVLAISEADFDLATGKLSDDDYRVLRSDYEGRALHAMDEIEKLVPVATAAAAGASSTAARFCAGCGAKFADSDAYCASCGRARGGL